MSDSGEELNRCLFPRATSRILNTALDVNGENKMKVLVTGLDFLYRFKLWNVVERKVYWAEPEKNIHRAGGSVQKTKMKAVAWTPPAVRVQRDAILKDIQHHSPTVPLYQNTAWQSVILSLKIPRPRPEQPRLRSEHLLYSVFRKGKIYRREPVYNT